MLPTVEVELLGHAKQVLADAKEYVPMLQYMHVLAVVEREVTEYLPASQSVQIIFPVNKYFPASQGKQILDPSNENIPTPQLIHVLATVAPVNVEYLPATQSMHIVAPVIEEYLPVPHILHIVAPVISE